MFDFTQVFKIIDYLMLFVQVLLETLTNLAINITLIIIAAKAALPFIGDPNFASLNQSGIAQIRNLVNPLNNFFPHSNIDLTNPQALENLITDFSAFFGATTILILLPIAILSGFGFLREGDTKLAIYSFLGFQLILIVAIFTENILISTEINSSNIFAMIFSPLFTLGFLLYLQLEIAFQTSYTLNILNPMTEREKRIQKHLARIRAFVPKSEEEEEGKERTVGSMQSSKFDLLAASYLREMVERRVFKTGEMAIDAKSMMRLQSYLASLNQSDPQTDLKLAAKTAQPDISALIKHFIPTMIFRISAVVLLAYIIMSPEGILNFFMSFSFPALLDSLELSQPEFRTIAILNFVLLFILIGAVLHYLSSGRTVKVLERVVQQIDTLVDFDRGKPSRTPSEGQSSEEESVEEASPEDQEEVIS